MDLVWGPVISHITNSAFTICSSTATSEAPLMSSANHKIVAPDANRCTEAWVPKGSGQSQHQTFQVIWNSGQKEESGERGEFASEPRRRQSSNLQWNGKKKEKKEMKKDEKGGGRSGSMASSSVIPPKGQDFCRWNWEEQQNCRCTEQQGIFRCHDQLRRAPLKHICQ